jgi:hypothetical protein
MRHSGRCPASHPTVTLIALLAIAGTMLALSACVSRAQGLETRGVSVSALRNADAPSGLGAGAILALSLGCGHACGARCAMVAGTVARLVVPGASICDLATAKPAVRKHRLTLAGRPISILPFYQSVSRSPGIAVRLSL